MDAAVLLKTADLIFKFLGSPISIEIQSIWGYETEIKKLADTIEFIGDVLSDAEGKQFQDSHVIRGLQKLLEAFLDAGDFLDRVQTHKNKLEADHKKLKKVRRFFSSSNPAKHAINVHKAMEKIKMNLDATAQDLQKFGLSDCSNTKSTYRRNTETGSFVNAASIIGRDKDKSRVIDLLLGASVDQGQIPVISIVGIGGMGKTTLAQLVYDDNSFLESCRFDLKSWVSDSQEFDLSLLLKKILKSISPSDPNLDNLGRDELQSRFSMEIRGKKYLLVLDDVKNESRLDWVELEELLKLGAKGSKILVTTRSRRVANVMSSDSMAYELKGLSEENSWLLFEKMAFRGSKDENLVKIGVQIIKKCSCVPLAIKTIGCLLYGQDKRKWEHVRADDLGKIKDEGNDIIPVLRVSYDALDPKLKECFRYCSLFPKSYIFSKKLLIDIWMSNVLIKGNKGRSQEDVGEQISKVLYNRCFLEEVKRNEWGDVTLLKMHDLMHDLAKDVGGSEMFVVDSDIKVDSGKLILEENVRHLTLMRGTMTIDGNSTFGPKARQLRTLLCYNTIYSKKPCEKLLFVDKLVSDCQSLRMLDLHGQGIENLTKSIGDLIHLRYLNLSGNQFKTLPSSIAELWNLQSLELQDSFNLKELPMGIRKLINLRHLNLACCTALTHMPSGMGALTSLKVLNISYCFMLQELAIEFEKLINLKCFNLAGCKALTHLPSGVGELTSLEVFDISYCDMLKELPMGVERLINLLRLYIRHCHDFEHIPWGMGAFTSLEVLDISHCCNLKELPMDIDGLMNLRHFNIEGCNSLLTMPSGIGALMSVCKLERFVIGDLESKRSAQLEELESLSELQENLIIELPISLTVRKGPGDDEAILINKKRLQKLEIKWQDSPNQEVRPRNDMDVLGKLQPPPSLRIFRLHGYQGIAFPPWVPKHDFGSVLPNLLGMYISDCGKCKHLPPISSLPRLKHLELSCLSSLEYIEENDSVGPFCPSLERVVLYMLPELKGWYRVPATGVEEEHSLILPSVPRHLDIRICDCPNVMVTALFQLSKQFP